MNKLIKCYLILIGILAAPVIASAQTLTGPDATSIQGKRVKSPLTCSDGFVITWVAASGRFECLASQGGGGGNAATPPVGGITWSGVNPTFPGNVAVTGNLTIETTLSLNPAVGITLTGGKKFIGDGSLLTGTPVYIPIALSDESTVLTTGTNIVTIRAPFAFTLTGVRLALTTASSSGLPAVDLKMGGVSVFSTLPTINVNQLTSTTATTPAVISTSAITDDSQLTLSVTVAGTGATGLKVWILGAK